MDIRNRTDRTVAYELRGGPVGMTLSWAFLEPGEDEVWESPYRDLLDCEVVFTVDEVEVRGNLRSDQNITLTDEDGVLTVTVA